MIQQTAVSPIPLTTWAVDTVEMARLAVESLKKRMQGEGGFPQQQITGGHLVLRGTVKALSP